LSDELLDLNVVLEEARLRGVEYDRLRRSFMVDLGVLKLQQHRNGLDAVDDADLLAFEGCPWIVGDGNLHDLVSGLEDQRRHRGLDVEADAPKPGYRISSIRSSAIRA